MHPRQIWGRKIKRQEDFERGSPNRPSVRITVSPSHNYNVIGILNYRKVEEGRSLQQPQSKKKKKKSPRTIHFEETIIQSPYYLNLFYVGFVLKNFLHVIFHQPFSSILIICLFILFSISRYSFFFYFACARKHFICIYIYANICLYIFLYERLLISPYLCICLNMYTKFDHLLLLNLYNTASFQKCPFFCLYSYTKYNILFYHPVFLYIFSSIISNKDICSLFFGFNFPFA